MGSPCKQVDSPISVNAPEKAVNQRFFSKHEVYHWLCGAVTRPSTAFALLPGLIGSGSSVSSFGFLGIHWAIALNNGRFCNLAFALGGVLVFA